jgi:hypothetical protein
MGKEVLASRSSPMVVISFQIIAHLYRREDVEKERKDYKQIKIIISADKTPTINFPSREIFSTLYFFMLTIFSLLFSIQFFPHHCFHPHGPLTPTPSARLFGYQSLQRLFSIHCCLNSLSHQRHHNLLPGETKL